MPRAHMTDKHVAVLIRMHKAGATVGEISQKIGFSCDAIRSRLTRMSLKPNKNSGGRQMTASFYENKQALERSTNTLERLARRNRATVERLMRLP